MKRILYILLASLLAIAMGCSEDNKSEEEIEEEEEEVVVPVEQEPEEQDFDICHLGDKKPCYTGSAKTRGVGICKEGYYNCIVNQKGDLMWDESRCIGEVHPDYSYPCTPKDPSRDFDCNGVPDNEQDDDKDGFTICTRSGQRGDCCDNSNMCLPGTEG